VVIAIRFVKQRAFIVIGAINHNSPHITSASMHISFLEDHHLFIITWLIRVLVPMIPEIGPLEIPVRRFWRTECKVL
jgi:hypothetical protein